MTFREPALKKKKGNRPFARRKGRIPHRGKEVDFAGCLTQGYEKTRKSPVIRGRALETTSCCIVLG